ncbi:MAG TPA: aldo/keto reductase [Chthoniobacteraceae bacterium]|jgi:aryl-alcohol dehydrogenase-like predicted oxidoreductase|nr:aldo/keto reductase [Chthoniobacteraceae bacterium]
MSIPMRGFGKTGVQISALGLGGHHLGDAKDQDTAIKIVHEAIDGGITFFDNCWEYNRGKSESWMGKALRGKREKVFLMTKVCTHGRDAALAMEMLEQSLNRLHTDHLDLWQIHGVAFDNDPELFIRPNGAAEALAKAKEQGKVRFLGFTGHKAPHIHLQMLDTGFPFDAVQMPLNPFDATFQSFEQQVLPRLNQRGLAVIGMKPLTGKGEPLKKGILTPDQALRYAMSLPVSTTITGMEKLDVLHQNLRIAQNFQPLSPQEMDSIREQCRSLAADGRFEHYKGSLQFDNPEARWAHHYPIDPEQKEVKEMLLETTNTGRPYPEVPS